MLEDGVLTFSQANGNAIKFIDPDQALDEVEVKFRSDEGLITPVSSPSVLISRSGNETLIRGSFANVNAALNGLTYRPWPDSNTDLTNQVNSPQRIMMEYRTISVGNTPLQFSKPPMPKLIAVNVTPVNDAPNFVAGANQTVTAGSGVREINGWATGFTPIAVSQSSGYPYDRETSQILLGYEVVSNDRPDLFDGNITIDPTGKLTFKTVGTLATAGVATIGVRVRDNGGTANGGIDTSAVKYFTITVNPSITPSDWFIAATADFDGDGDLDILRRNSVTGANMIWQMNGTSLNQVINLRANTSSAKVEGVADFDGDGKVDILWRNYSNGVNTVWKMNGVNLVGGIGIRGESNLAAEIEAIADFDGDGKVDILWRNYQTGVNTIWKMNGTTVIQGIGLRGESDLSARIEAIADFDGDGKIDILWRSYQTGYNTIWKMDGMNLVFGIAIRGESNLDAEISGVADFDGDGKMDILWRNWKTGVNTIWKMNEMTVIQGIALPSIYNMNSRIKRIGDFDGDGKVDILWENQASRTTNIWKMNGISVADNISI
jgi:hypothetical protein